MATLADYDNILKEFNFLKDFYASGEKDFDAFVAAHGTTFTAARLLCLKKKYKTAQEQDDPGAWVAKELKKYEKKHAAKTKEGEADALKQQVAELQAKLAAAGLA